MQYWYQLVGMVGPVCHVFSQASVNLAARFAKNSAAPILYNGSFPPAPLLSYLMSTLLVSIPIFDFPFMNDCLFSCMMYPLIILISICLLAFRGGFQCCFY